MPTDNMIGLSPTKTVAHDTLITTLRSTLALEKQVIAVLVPQLGILADYPDLHAKITHHIGQTHEQVRRLEVALQSCSGNPSVVIEALQSAVAFGQSAIQGMGLGADKDTVLKAIVDDMSTEHLEIATYRTLIVLAEMAGRPDLCLAFEHSLHEEETMSDWFNQNLEQLTRHCIELAGDDLRATALPVSAGYAAADAVTPYRPSLADASSSRVSHGVTSTQAKSNQAGSNLAAAPDLGAPVFGETR